VGLASRDNSAVAFCRPVSHYCVGGDCPHRYPHRPLFAPIKIAPPVSVANALRLPVNWELLALPVDIDVTT
jgi:hypothetical protein